MGRPIWELGRNPNLRIKIVCQSDSKAKERLFEIKTHLEQNPIIHEIFPNLKPASIGEWTKHKIVVERDMISKDASIEAVGVLSAATGGRADILIADDVVDRRNAIQYPKLRQEVINSWRSDWTQLLEPGGRIWYIATPWHTADLSHELKKNPVYKVLSYPILPDLVPLWPTKWGKKELEHRKLEIGKTAFERGFLLVALTGDVIVVQPYWIKGINPDNGDTRNQYYARGSLPPINELIRVTGIDPRGADEAKTGREDYFALVTLGYHPPTNRIFVLDAWKGQPSFLQQMKRVKSNYVKWREKWIGIEGGAYQDALRHALNEKASLPLVKMTPGNMSKGLRLFGITDPVEAGMVWFPEKMDPDSNQFNREREDLVEQLFDFPLGRYNDFVDAFVWAMKILLDYVMLAKGYGDDEDEDEDEEGGDEVDIDVI